MERKDRIVVTGTGIVCGAGGTPDEVWQVLESGQSAISENTRWDVRDWPVKLGCPVQLSNRDLVSDRKLHKSISRTDLFGIYAGEQAIEKAGLMAFRESLSEAERILFNDRSGLIVGSGGGDLSNNYDFLPLMSAVDRDLPQFGKALSEIVTPMWLLRNLPNNVLCHVGIRAMFKGTNACITNQIAGGLMAVSESAEAIWYDEADRVVAIAHDAISEPETVYYYHKMGLISEYIPRPFDADRQGIVIGEGAAAVALEKESDARARGAKVWGEILGSGCVTEATGIMELAPDGNGVTRAVEMALENAGVLASQIGMICAHGNGARTSDLTEALGLNRVFGEDMPPVTAMKWAYGHLIGAAGMTDVVMTLEALRRGVVPGIPTLQRIDPGMGNLSVAKENREPTSNKALIVSRGFGGMNAALVVGV